MTWEMIFLLTLLLIMFGCLFFEIARPELIIFSVLVILLTTKMITPKEALSGFSNEGMMTVALLFIVAEAIQKSGLIDSLIERWLKKSTSLIESKLRFFVPISLFSAFLNNTPIVVTFTPIIKNWCEERGIAPSKFLIPLSYITILGGTITLMGTSTNIVVHGMLLENGYPGFSLFSFTVVGIPVTIVGMLYLFVFGDRLLPDNKGFRQQVKEKAKEYIVEIHVESNFPFINKSVERAGLRNFDEMYLIEIIRRNDRVSPVRNSTIIQQGDRLIFSGQLSSILELQQLKGLKVHTGTNVELDELKNGSTYLVEAVVSHQSYLLSKSIKQSQFRSRYDAGVIAIHRNNERILGKIGDIIVKPGDSLLLLAGADFIEKHRNSNDFYIVSQLDTPKQFKQNYLHGILSLGLLILMIALVSFQVLSMLNAMAIAVLTLIISKLLSAEDIKRSLSFNVLLIIASSIGVGTAMIKTGLAEWIALSLMKLTDGLGLIAILLLLYVLTNIFTEFISNSAAAVLMLPIGLKVAESIHVDPIGIAILIAVAASASFMTPIGYQTNLIVYGPGGYKFSDYVKVGAPLSLIVMIITVTIVYNVWF